MGASPIILEGAIHIETDADINNLPDNIKKITDEDSYWELSSDMITPNEITQNGYHNDVLNDLKQILKYLKCCDVNGTFTFIDEYMTGCYYMDYKNKQIKMCGFDELGNVISSIESILTY